tara:strand:- start:406 stop:1086 length:681 start_codon:yes stop_codon:yes gene_type:complete
MKKKVLLIGGSSKLGTSIIKKLNKKNYNIISTYYKNKIPTKNFKIHQVKIDLKNLIMNTYPLSEKNFDFIFFLSGNLDGKSLLENSDENINKTVQINFSSQILLLKKILKFQKKTCLLVFISSISGRKGSYDPVYAATKGGLIAFAKSLSLWMAPKIKCITICPGVIKNTNMFKTFKKDRIKKLIKNTPNKELLNSEDLSEIIIDLMKPHWRHANGSVIDINGGLF